METTSRNHAALQRLVARHHSLCQDSAVASVLSKGLEVEDDDITSISSELLMRPEFTVATAGCFRHLLPQMVRNLVDFMREKHACRILTHDNKECDETFSSLDTWNLCVHEQVVMAFSRIAELAPSELSTILQYFLFAPSPFERLLRSGLAAQSNWKNPSHLLNVLRATYRLIQVEPCAFEGLWDWTPLLDLFLYKDSEELIVSQNTADVRWCAIQIFSVMFQLNDEATRYISSNISSLTEDIYFMCLLRWEEFCQDIAIEKAGWVVEPFSPSESCTLKQGGSPSDMNAPLISEVQEQVRWKSHLWNNISCVEVCGIELPVHERLKTYNLPSSFRKSFFLTASLNISLRALVLALSQSEPILLEGPAGSGKTSMIEELGRITGNSDAIFIHLDEQMDSKTLLGMYVCSEIPGEFRWKPGVLTQAVEKGMWVVFEDIDRAPFEILSALVPLLEDRKLYIPGRAETIMAAKGFQILATVTRTDMGSTSHSSGWSGVQNLWRKIVIDAPTDNEVGAIIESTFPVLTPIVPKLIATFKMINSIASQLLPSLELSSARKFLFGRDFSMRDLLKWCARIRNFKEAGSFVLSSSVREAIYREAVDCFAGCISSPKSHCFVAEAIAKLWDVSKEQVLFFETLNKPILQVSATSVQVGRAFLPVNLSKEKLSAGRLFVNTGHAMRKLESIAICILQQEPVLLVGETGTGKTTLVQHLARLLCMPLTVMNLSQQTDSADFLGGFKPVEVHRICMSLLEKFVDLFSRTFPAQSNVDFMVRVHQFAAAQKTTQLMKAFGMAVSKVKNLSGSTLEEASHESKSMLQAKSKRKRPLHKNLVEEWKTFSKDLAVCERQVKAAESSFAFSYVEGAFVKAFKNGHWILLDELNLAPAETLERLTGVLEGEHGSLTLTERGDIECVPRHPNFRIFACMNPATDVGKHDLPIALKNRFTELYIGELTEKEDLHKFVYQYLEGSMPSPPVTEIVDFYQQAKEEADTRIFDSADQKPKYSLRTLARALEYTQAAMPIYGFSRALYDGICMTFLTMLDRPSSMIMESLILSKLFKQSGLALTDSLFAKVPRQPSGNHILFEHFWLERGTWKPSKSSVDFTHKYVLTKSIRKHLKNLAKAVFIHRYPVLLQGPTSSGKTSLIEYLATITNHRFVRINNHEHTDLQEYLGTYVTGASGKLVFQEGILVEAVRNGYWIVLDELNLAPSEVLEALNRLLDDNRELFVPETQITVKPHPQFMLFATQNPPGLYGGRKVLSRAFRNRFLELHVDDIPEDELCSILEQRCEIPRSHAEKMVAVMKDLQRNRQSSQVFAGKHGFITPRDLFRWADRHRKAGTSYDDLAKFGYILLAERLRQASERLVVREVLEKNMRVKLDIETLYGELSTTSKMQGIKKWLLSESAEAAFGKIVWTKSMRRLFSLVENCYEHNEPILLVGETGCGKTTVCQLLAMVYGHRLQILNCHQHTETSDFLGGFRPIREKDGIALQYEKVISRLNRSQLFCKYHGADLPADINSSDATLVVVDKVLAAIRSANVMSQSEISSAVGTLTTLKEELVKLQLDFKSLFRWQDGPLVEAMRKGEFFLVDEISLADDSVLERLNSVLEPKRLLVLAEKGGSNVEELIAHPKFLLMATMNPGGDFGKKELSPALRNRFTEIWVPPILDEDDLQSIILARLARQELSPLAGPLLKFFKWFQQQYPGRSLTARDILAWVTFINTVEMQIGMFNALIHGAFLVLLDGIGLETGLSNESAESMRKACLDFLLQQLPSDDQQKQNISEPFLKPTGNLSVSNSTVGISPFFIPKGAHEPNKVSYELMAPTTSINSFRIFRAMQLQKAVLLEGSPGVGKTSLVAAVANISGYPLVRINLSEQTDMMDLLGSDLPVEGPQGAEFGWSDGVFLQALKAGSWVILDELNLASQSVLEGLNACLDHRGEVFIPELGRSFKCPPTFRVFACQNPSYQGGGRKCLPKSFLNRFTKVFVDKLLEDDFLFICSSLHPTVSKPFLQKVIHFNSRILEDTMVSRVYGQSGAPWEFNLRDVLRSCTLIEENNDDITKSNFLEVVYLQRMRNVNDRCSVIKLYEEVFGCPPSLDSFPRVSVHSKSLRIGNVTMNRAFGAYNEDPANDLVLLPGQGKCLEAIMQCVQHGWMSILVGPPACGKTSLVRLLSKLTGNPLKEFTLSTGTDTTELLGCFEQHDLFRNWQDLLKRVCHLVHSVCSLCLTASVGELPVTMIMSSVRLILAEWSTFQKSVQVRCNGSVWSQALVQQNENKIVDFLTIELLSKVLDQLRSTVSNLGETALGLLPEIQATEIALSRLKKFVGTNGDSRQFEWVDGGFLKAVERGDWVLLENANLCNPTVLDRLNPLLEANGTILINERGLVDGNALILRAHPNFRLFLTVDPHYGEVSRAMRNRGVEIYVMPGHWLTQSVEAAVCTPRLLLESWSLDQDVMTYLVSRGLPGVNLVEAMLHAHEEASKLAVSSVGHHISLRQLGHWVRLFRLLFERGSGLLDSLRSSWEQVYVQGHGDVNARVLSKRVFDSHFSMLNVVAMSHRGKKTLQLPGGWPSPITLIKLCRWSLETTVLRDCMYLELLIGEQVASHILAAWIQHTERNAKDCWHTWIQKENRLAVMFPALLFQFLLHPASVDFKNSEELTHQCMLDLDRMIVYAGLWMMEQACDGSDMELRMVWLKALTERVGSHCRSLMVLCKIFKRESEYPAFKQLIGDGDYLPLANTMAHKTSANICVNYWTATVSVGRKLCAVRYTLLQWQIEDDVFDHAKNSTPSRSEPWIIQSLRRHAYQPVWNRRMTTMNELRESLYPILDLARKLEEEMLTHDHSAWNEKLDNLYYKFLQCHKSFWRVIYQDKDTHALVHRLHKLKRCSISLRTNVPKSDDRFEKVILQWMQVIQNIDEALAAEVGVLKSYLWKYAGHPFIPNSKALFDQQQSLLNFCHGLWPEQAHDIEKIVTDEVFRWLALEGISMSMWLLQGHWKEKHTTQRQGVSAQEIVLLTTDILKKLAVRLDAEKMHKYDHSLFNKNPPTNSSSMRSCKCLPSHSFESSYHPEALLKGMCESSFSMVMPWLDSLSLDWDAVVCRNALHVAVSSLCEEESFLIPDVQMQHIKRKISEMIGFSLKFTSRSPLDFAPHQQLLWLIDGSAGGELDKREFTREFVNVSHQSLVNWHSACWRSSLDCDLEHISSLWSFTTGPSRLFQASESTRISNLILQEVQVSDYKGKIVLLRLASGVLWRSVRMRNPGIVISIHSLASLLLCQIVFSFSKTFQKEDIREIQSLLMSLHPKELELLQQDNENIGVGAVIHRLSELLPKSKEPIFVALLDSYLIPCMELLYLDWHSSSDPTDMLLVLGKLWLLLGSLRLRLVLPAEVSDPGAKYAQEYAVLSEDLYDLRLDLQVRQDSHRTVRGGLDATEFSALTFRIRELEQDIITIQSKMVYRSHPGKINAFYNDVKGFVQSLDASGSFLAWVDSLKHAIVTDSSVQSKQEILQWQDLAMQFVRRLSADYPDFMDLAQPVQLAVYEFKLGLSLLFSAWLRRNYFERGEIKFNENIVIEAVCNVMEFPTRTKPEHARNVEGLRIDSKICLEDIFELLENRFLESVLQMLDTHLPKGMDVKSAAIQFRIKVFQWAIGQLRSNVIHTGLLSVTSLNTAVKLLKAVSVFWKDLRSKIDAKKANKDSLIQFKHQIHTVDLEPDGEDASFRNMFPDYLRIAVMNSETSDGSTQKRALDDEISYMGGAGKSFISDQDWEACQDILSREVTSLEAQIFTFNTNCQKSPVHAIISEDQKLQDFSLAYDMGNKLLNGLGALFPSNIDKRLMSAHILRVSMEHNGLVSACAENRKDFNIYKDSSPPDVAMILEPLLSFEEHITSLLSEWPEHPVLMQLSNSLQSLLMMPLNVPLMKALIRVEQLLAKAQLWEENAPKHLSLADNLNRLVGLVIRWRKLELTCWGTLMANVEQEFEVAAEKLWFPLYEVLHPDTRLSSDAELEPTIASLEEFIQTSKLGEYKSRLQILSGFYGEFYAQRNFESPPCGLPRILVERVCRILYNIVRYYHQFVPLIEESICFGRSNVQRELDDFVRLCKWDERNYYSLVSSTESSHRKVYKLVKKYKDVLAQPVLAILLENKESLDITRAWTGDQLKALNDTSKQNVGKPCASESENVVCGEMRLNQMWELYLEEKLQDLFVSDTENTDLTAPQELKLSSVLPMWWKSTRPVSEIWKRGIVVVEDLSNTIITRASLLREGETKRMVKKKALVDLLKALRSIGLSHHRSAVPKDERTTKSWFQQPPCDVDSLLAVSLKTTDHMKCSTTFERESIENSMNVWKRSTEYYFKNMALVNQLQKSSLSFHKDLTLQEVATSTAYMEHLFYLEQRQRQFAFDYCLQLVHLQTIANEVGSFGKLDNETRLPEQGFLRNWLWVQKDLLDCLCNTCLEASVFYKTVIAAQSCPFEDTPAAGFGSVRDTLEKMTGTLRSCKRQIDSIVVPGSELLGCNELESAWPVLVTTNMEKILIQNFMAIEDIKSFFNSQSLQVYDETLENTPGLGLLSELINQGLKMFKDYENDKETVSRTGAPLDTANKDFQSQYEEFFTQVLLSVGRPSEYEADINTMNGSAEELATLQNWTSVIEKQMSALQLYRLHRTAVLTAQMGVACLSSSGNSDTREIRRALNLMHIILSFIVSAGHHFLTEYLSLHKSVVKLGYILCKIFASLFHEGFCSKQEEKEEDVSAGAKEAFGTGMGEGEGKADISNEIEDEDQLLGSQKQDKEDQKPQQDVGDTDKGIEMEQDFEADMFDVSIGESNETAEDDDEDHQVESKMGEDDTQANIVDEKLWDKEEDSLDNNQKEKYETGTGIESAGTNLEFRAKDTNGETAAENDEVEESLGNELSDHEDLDNKGREEGDANMPQEEGDGYEDPSGINPSAEDSELHEETNIDMDGADDHPDAPVDDDKESMDINGDINDGSSSPGINEQEGQQPDSSYDEMLPESEEHPEGHPEEKIEELDQTQGHQTLGVACGQSGVQGMEETSKTERKSLFDDAFNNLSAVDPSTQTLSSADNGQNDLYDASLLSTDPEQGLSISKPFQEQRSGMHWDRPQETKRLETNPYRSLGDALEEWKERAVIKDGLAADEKEIDVNEETEDAGFEYQYVKDNDKSNAQTLGAATAEQLDQSRVKHSALDKKEPVDIQESAINMSELQMEEEEDYRMADQNPVQNTIVNKSLVKSEKVRDQDPLLQDMDLEMADHFEHHITSNSESYARSNVESTEAAYATPKTLSSQPDIEEVKRIRRELEINILENTHSIERARSMWVKFEQLTSRLSQELTEQLRLIMEPTLAARLEGDYRTGKRINMKKVIPYIASQFRKDKIWLRRTRPSKRQYQVVLAIDDSRSMSESHCGHMALEALITICRSMATLDVGQMAVASFGKKGNVKLLHDFEQTFSTDTAIRMISQFSFKQDNTIADEPVVDLLHYLTWMLDVAAKSAATPSGHSHLQQLILIIADGRFHEKETLRRCIREAVSRGQMLALIILDNLHESIMDVQSVSFSNGAPTFSKYIDTFPFPYYILLKDIEALPQTLADLLRQWFELTQRSTNMERA